MYITVVTRNMKTIKVSLTIIVLAMSLLPAGCTKDTNSTPDSSSRDAFLGKWTVRPTTKLTYEVIISADPNSPDGVFISNFADVGTTSAPAGAEIKGNSIVLDANQVIGDGLKINGSGTYTGTKIIWNYTIFDGADLTSVAETYTRQ